MVKAFYDVSAPAKINLFLHITERRPDGYHLLQSVFSLIDWCDTLHYEVRSDGLLSRHDLGTALPAVDLSLKAARSLQSATGCTSGADIFVDKRIPTEAGLGGGSSDAASTLIALNRLWNLKLTRHELTRIGQPLGSDVPFFLATGDAWVEGTGEIVMPLAPEFRPPVQRFVVVKPAAGLATPKIFSEIRAEHYFGGATISGFVADHFGFGRNDLQSTAERLCPEVSQVLAWLKSLGLVGRMTGSGSAVFAAIPQTFDVPSPPGSWQIKVCENLASHPLAGWTTD